MFLQRIVYDIASRVLFIDETLCYDKSIRERIFENIKFVWYFLAENILNIDYTYMR